MNHGYISPLNTTLTRDELIERYNALIDYVEEIEAAQELKITEFKTTISMLEEALMTTN